MSLLSILGKQGPKISLSLHSISIKRRLFQWFYEFFKSVKHINMLCFGRFISVSHGKQMAKDRYNSVLLFALHLNTYINGIQWFLKTLLCPSTSSYIHRTQAYYIYVHRQTHTQWPTLNSTVETEKWDIKVINKYIKSYVNYPLQYGSKIKLFTYT